MTPPGVGVVGIPNCPPCCNAEGVVGPGTAGNDGAPGVVTVGVPDGVVMDGVPDDGEVPGAPPIPVCANTGVATSTSANAMVPRA